MVYMLQFGESATHRIFVAWVVFRSSCLNLKPDDGFLPYITPELFNKTDIVIAWDEFKRVLHAEYFGE